jgi:hypothetical protein
MPRDIPQEIHEINRQLIQHYGIDTDSNFAAMWRLAWSEDQYEHRLTNYTDEGLLLLHPEVRLLPKYRQWIQPPCWVLERLVVVPIVNQNELPSTAKSYEPIHPFLNPRDGNAIEPVFRACKFLVDLVYSAMDKKGSGMAKYVDELAKETPEEKKIRIDKLVDELFGDESMLLGRTVTGEAVGYTTSEEKK